MRDSTHSAAVLPEKFADLPGRMQGFAQRIINRSGLTGRFGDPVEDSKWSAVSPTTMARNADLDVLKSLRIYFDAGTDDRYDLAPLNQELSRILGQREVSHAFRIGRRRWALLGLGCTAGAATQVARLCRCGVPGAGSCEARCIASGFAAAE